MFKTDKVVFKKLNKMPITKRIEVASSPQGQSILSALSATEFAELFPRHYQRGLPDVSGFRAATTAAAQKRQSEASAGILDRLTRMEQGAESYASEIYKKVKRKLGLEREAAAELTPEQDAAFKKLQAGNLPINSDEGKIFSKLTDQQLSSIGVSKSKDNTGREVFNYAAPQVGREEAEARLRTSISGDWDRKAPQVMDRLQKDLGITREQAAGIVGSLKPESGLKAIQEKTPWAGRGGFGWAQWTGPRRVAFEKFAESKGMNLTDDETNYQFLIHELKGSQAAELSRVKSAKTASEAAHLFTGSTREGFGYLRPGAEHYGASERAAERAMTLSGIEKPKGQDGSYSEEQITKMMDQLREEKNATRKQQLANLLTGAGVDTATVNSISQVKTSGVVGQHLGEGVQCVALSKHFAPQIGPASKWQFNEGTAGIVPGAVIATRRYADGSGGKMASQMPDGQSHYHTGIALTRPDAQGNVLIFDQAKAYGSKISKVNINDYHGETWGVVRGGEPTPRSMEAVNMALSRANDSEKAAITESMRGSTPKVATSTGEVKANVDVGPVPTKPVNQEGDPLPPQQVSTKQPGAPQEPAPQVKADAPPPAPKIQPARYKFNEQSFIKEVRAKNTGAMFVSDEYIMGETLKGFKDTPGVKYDRKTGTLTIEDPNSPAIQKVVSDMRANNLDEKSFLNKMKEEKPTPPPETKPKEQKPVAPPPEKKAEAPAAPTPPPQAQAPAPEQPKVEAQPVQEPPKVPGASDGGLFDVGNRDIGFYPMDKRDNVAAVDTKTQQPLFTARTGENVSMDQQGRVDVSPSQKVNGIAPAQDNVRNEIETLRREIGSSFSNAGNITSPPQIRQIDSTRSDNPNFIDKLTKLNADQWNNKVMERAMNRTRLQETGDSLNNHFSYGNTNS